MSTLNDQSFRSDTLQNKDTDSFFEPEKFKELIGLSQPAPVTDSTVTPPENVAGQVYFDPSAFKQLLELDSPPQMAPVVSPAQQTLGMDADFNLASVPKVLRTPLAEMSQPDLVELQTMHSQVMSGKIELDEYTTNLLKQKFEEAMAENRWETGGGFGAGMVSAAPSIIGGGMAMAESVESGQFLKRPVSFMKRLWDNASPESLLTGDVVSKTIGQEVMEGADPEVEKLFAFMRDVASTPEQRAIDDFALGLMSIASKAQEHPDFRASLTTLNAMSREEINADTLSRAVGQGLSSLVVIVGATALAGPGAGAVVGATMEAGNAAYSQYENVYDKLLKEGVEENKAHAIARTSAYDTGLFYGLAAGALESAGAYPVAKSLGLIGRRFAREGVKQTGKEAVISWTAKVLSSAASEGGTEFAQAIAEKIVSISQDPTIPPGEGLGVLSEWIGEQGFTEGELMMSLYAGALTGGGATAVPTLPQMVFDASARPRNVSQTQEIFDEAPTTPGDPSQAPPTIQPVVNPVTGQLEVRRDTPPETTPIDFPTDPDTGQPLDPVTTDTALVVNPVTGQLEVAPAVAAPRGTRDFPFVTDPATGKLVYDPSAPAGPSPDAVEAPVTPLEPTEAPVAPEAPLEPTEAPVTPEEPDAPFDQPGGFDQINEIKVWKHQGHKLRDLAKDPKAAQNLKELGIEQLGFAHLIMPGAKDGPAADLAKSLGVEEAAGAFAPSDARRGSPRKIADWVNERRVIGHELFHAIWHAQLGDSTKNQIAEAMGSWRPQRVIDRVRPEHPEREIEEAMADIIAGAMYGFQPMRGVGIDKGDVPSGLLDVANEIIQQNPALQRLQDDAEMSMLEELDEQKRKRDLGKPPKPAINFEATAVQQAIETVGTQVPPKLNFEAAANAFVKVDEFKTIEMGDLQQSLQKLADGMVALDQGKEWPATKQRPGQKRGEYETVRDFESEAIRDWYENTYLKQRVGATVPPEDEIKMEEAAEPQVRTFESITSDKELLDAFVQENLDAVQEILADNTPTSRKNFTTLEELLGSKIPFRKNESLSRAPLRQPFIDQLQDSVNRIPAEQAPADAVAEQAPVTDAIEEQEDPLGAFRRQVEAPIEESLDPAEFADFDTALDDIGDLLDNDNLDGNQDESAPWSRVYSEEQGDLPSTNTQKKIRDKLIDAMAAMSKTKTPSFYQMANVILAKNDKVPVSLMVDAYRFVYASKSGDTDGRASGKQLTMTNPDFLETLLSEDYAGLQQRVADNGTTTGVDPMLVLFDAGYAKPKQITDRGGTYWLVRHGTNEFNSPLNHMFGQVGTERKGNVTTFEEYTGLKAEKIVFVQKRKPKGMSAPEWAEKNKKLPTDVKVYIDEDPTLGLARGIQYSEETGGTEAPTKRSEIAIEGAAARSVNAAKQREDEFSLREIDDFKYASAVSESVRNTIERGRAFGLTESTIRGQLADIGLITEGFFGDKPLTTEEVANGVEAGPKKAFILANEAGTGKTFVLLGAAAEILNKEPQTTVTYLTTGQNLVAQIVEDGKNLLLEDGTPVTDRIRFMSYAELRKLNPADKGTPSDTAQSFADELAEDDASGRPLFILDEPDSELAGVPNLGMPTGKITAQIMAQVNQQDGMTIISSATPFQNPYHAKYIAASGVFGKPKTYTDPRKGKSFSVSGFDYWALLHGAQPVGRTDNSSGKQTVQAVWYTSDETEALRKAAMQSKQAMEWFQKRGMFTRRIKTLPTKLTVEKDGKETEVNFVEMKFTQVDVNLETIPGSDLAGVSDTAITYSQYASLLTDTVDFLNEQENVAGIDRQTQAWVVNKLKRISEGAKSEKAKTIVREHLNAGKQVIVFTETKAETAIGQFSRPEGWLDAKGKKDETVYDKSDVISEYEDWMNVGKEQGDEKPFTSVAYDVARILEQTPELELELPSVVDELSNEFSDFGVGNYTGSVPLEERVAAKKAWENGETRLLVATMGAGGTGVSFHDKAGNRKNGTAQVNLSLPWVAAKVDQVAGRVARYGMKSEVSIDWLFARSQDMPFERQLAKRVATRMIDMNAVVKGFSPESLKSTNKLLSWDFEGSVDASDAILNGYKGVEESDSSAIRKQDYTRAVAEQENKGGVKAPKNIEASATPRPMAMLLARLVGARVPATPNTKQKILDPTAGTGAALRYVDFEHDIVINDPKKGQIDKALRMLPTGVTTYEGRFEDPELTSSIRATEGMFDSVVLVPPTTPENELEDSLAYTHIQNGYELLHDNGRMVAVVPEGVLRDEETKGYGRFNNWLRNVNVTIVMLPKSAMGYDSALLVFDKAFDGYTEKEFRPLDAREFTSLSVVEEQVGSRPEFEGTAQQEPIADDINAPDTTPEEDVLNNTFSSESVTVMLSERNQQEREDNPVHRSVAQSWGNKDFVDRLGDEMHKVVPAPLPSAIAESMPDLKMDQIRLDFERAMQKPIRKIRGGLKKNSGGFYSLKSGVIRIKYSNDFVAQAHEMGHFLHDNFGIMSEIGKELSFAPLGQALTSQEGTPETREMLDQFDQDMKFWINANGSSAKKNSSPSYVRGEMVAAFLVEYAFNPDNARRESPWFTSYLENRLSETTEGQLALGAIQAYGLKVRRFDTNDKLTKMRSTVTYQATWNRVSMTIPQRIAKAISEFNVRDGIKTNWHRFVYSMVDDQVYLKNAINELGQEAYGASWQKTVRGAENPLLRLSGQGGFADKFWNQARNGARSVLTGRRVTTQGIGDVAQALKPLAGARGERLGETYQKFESFMLVESAYEDALNNWRYAEDLGKLYKRAMLLKQDLQAQTAEISDQRRRIKAVNKQIEEGLIDPADRAAQQRIQAAKDAKAIAMETRRELKEEFLNLMEEVNRVGRRLYGRRIPAWLKEKDIGTKLTPLEAIDELNAYAGRKNDKYTPIGGGLTSSESEIRSAVDEIGNLPDSEREVYEEAAGIWREFAKAMVLKPLLDSGRISQEMYREIVSQRQFYTTMRRRIEDVLGEDVIDTSTGFGSKALSRAMRVPDRRGGSMAMFESPTQAMLDMAWKAQWEAERNLTAKSIVELLDATQSERVDPNLFDADMPPTSSNILWQMEEGEKTAPDAIPVFVNGEKLQYRAADKKVAETFAGLGEISDWGMFEFLNTARASLQYLITTSLPFSLYSRLRDSLDRAIKSQGGSKPWDSFESARRVARVGLTGSLSGYAEAQAEYQELEDTLVSLGGSQVGLWYSVRGGKNRYDKMVTNSIKEQEANKYVVFSTAAQFVKNYQTWKKSGEMKNRLAEFKRVRDKLIDEGLDPYDADFEAMAASRDLIDFAVGGKQAKWLSKVFMFFNPTIQGLRASGRTAKRSPGLFVSRILAYSIAPSLFQWMWNYAFDADEEYEELPDWEKAYAWNIRMPGTRDIWIRIPKPFELAAPGTIAEMVMQDLFSNSPDPYSGLPDVGKTLAGPIGAVKSQPLGIGTPIVSKMSNYNFFFNDQIIPAYEINKPLHSRNYKSMEKQPAWSQTRVGSILTGLATGDLVGEQSVLSDITGGEKQDPRMVTAIWSSMAGITGQEISKGYEAATKRDAKSIGDFLKYVSGRIITWDDKPARKSLDKYYDIASKLNRFPTDQTDHITLMIARWEKIEDAEEKVLHGRALVIQVREYTAINEMLIKSEKEVAGIERKAGF